MTNTLTVDQLQELLQIQKEFDDRIPTLNLQDSRIAYVVEFFEWFNTLETFKNWKKKPGKPLDVQLDELADMLAFGLSIANQRNIKEKHVEEISNRISAQKYKNSFDFFDKDYTNAFLSEINNLVNEKEIIVPIHLVLGIGKVHYTIDQLISAYKKKMERNHARQDGKADEDKGYV
ncbi:dUTP diphosphatase [Staphylococcus epidermidis]|uniref:dUTP diphosphatase n=1 Tax=Staphylococcus epidermidis TaxID=1282 RepID=UPI00026C0D1D|nr:dUTP diphosphatase [Staphylococcus epidermidis]EJD81232.1 hypothetical protein HMPREF9995_01690 [Staphylococcus epidermidis NIHLM095]EJD84213.1 hypothetical protein HMPREF9993_00447 [Staphylococcus epidermidis NIHLM087]QNL84812.1 dUTPase [Staphylococcus epidermidis]WEE07871.1 dUTP diphosphatase [Staphylococcus epidermidis]